jgi:hypothetical protein
MKFSQFIMDLLLHKNCRSAAELYDELGAEKKLHISLRTFRAVASGQIPPSLKLMSALFVQLPLHLKKDCVTSYFESSLEEGKEKELLCSFLSEEIKVAIGDDVESLWSVREPQLFSEKQLKYLASSSEIVRLYNRLVCYGSVSEAELKNDAYVAVMKNFEKLGIAKKQGSKFIRTKEAYRLPHQDNSPRDLVAPTSDFIVKHVETFLAREGAQGEQELGYAFHTCRKRDAEKILEQMVNFKKWVQKFALSEDHPDEVAFVWVDFARILRKDRDF